MGVFNRIGPYEYSHPASATTTVSTSCKVGPGTLHLIQINGGTLGTITIQDNATTTSNTTQNIAVITVPAGTTPTYLYDVHFALGLLVITAAATDLTVSFD